MRLLISFVLALFWLQSNAIDAAKVYDRYKVYNLTLDSASKSEFVTKYDGIEGYNFWLLPARGYAHLMVSLLRQSSFEISMRANHIVYNILQADVGQLILQEQQSQAKAEISVRSFPNDEFNFDHFPRYREIINFMNVLVRDKRYAKLITIGQSYEGKPIYAVEVKKSSDKPVFVVDAGIHAREWAAPVAAMYILKNVVENEEEYAERMSFVIIPCLNPDGYEYTHDVDRLWRKSRSYHAKSGCRGVDLNRNFDSHWGEFGAEKRPCKITFAGDKPFSEPESVALRDTILKYKPVAYLTLHAFGPFILYPWGFSKNLPSNWKTLDKIARKVAKRMLQNNGTNYKFGSSARVFYEASGASDDWAMEKANVSIVYTMELPEYNKGSFIVPKEMIKPLVEETFEAFSVMVESIVNE